ncbi:MAG: recombination protein O N-terminal domain-containing protein [Flavobacteriales bacterium]|jgi:DNA repair protein RecO (recombination protein O)|nr:recombination protein O N-terminal domain-containing protein [Flavobacteriales bacterium]
MLITAEAIVLRAIAHGDRSVVLKAWTRHAGARSYLVRLGAKGQQAALQPLSRIEVIADERPDRELHSARSVRVTRPFLRIAFDPVRGAVALFAQELFYRVLRAESADEELHEAVEEIIEAIDSQGDPRWLPHQALMRLSGPLGFRPELPDAGLDHFDLQEGRFVPAGARHGHLLAPPLSTALSELIRTELNAAPAIVATSAQRNELLDHLLLYYRLHLEAMGAMRSPAVLRAVLG